MSTKLVFAICGCLLVAGVTVFLVVHLVVVRNELGTQETLWHEVETSKAMENSSTETDKVVINENEQKDEPLPEADEAMFPEVIDAKELNESSTELVTELSESTTESNDDVTEETPGIGGRIGFPADGDPVGGVFASEFGGKFGVIVAPVTCDPPKRLDPISRRCRLNI